MLEFDSINPELIATCMHEAGHYICFTKYNIKCSYPVVVDPRAKYPSAYVECEPLKYSDPRILDDMIATLAGHEAQKRAIEKYGLQINPDRGCDTDRRHVERFKHVPQKSMGYIRSKARSRVITHWKEIDRMGQKLIRQYAPK